MTTRILILKVLVHLKLFICWFAIPLVTLKFLYVYMYTKLFINKKILVV